jgi:hypothetical protein
MEPVRVKLADDNRDLDTSLSGLESILQTIIQNKNGSVTLTGGEPTLRRDFFEILNRLAYAPVSVTVQTNGRLLGNPRAVRTLALLPHRNILFVVAVHGDCADIHDAVTGIDGSFAETISAVQNLLFLGFPVCGKTVISRLNLDTLWGTLDFMAGLGLTHAQVAFPHAEDFPENVFKAVVPRYAQLRRALGLKPPSLRQPALVRWETVPFCVFPDQAFYRMSTDLEYLNLLLRGDSTVIEMSMIGQQINWEQTRASIKVKPSQCNGCLLDYVCEGVWAEYLDSYGGEDFIPITSKEAVELFLKAM